MSRQLGAVAFTEAGSGIPVVLLHGFPLEGGMWQPQLEGLVADCRVIAPDLPGFGRSASLDIPGSIERMADDIAELLDALEIREPVVLGGLSMGGYVSLAFARNYPSRLRGLILADTKATPDDDAGKANRNKTIELAKSQGIAAVIDQMIPRALAAESLAQRPEVVETLRSLALSQSVAGVVGALQAMRDRPDSVPYLSAIGVPTLILVGEQDVMTPPALAEEMGRAIPGAKLIVIPGAGHMSNLEQPDLFNQAVREFVRLLA